MSIKNAALIGARGYTGLELASIILSHPNLNLKHVYSSNKNWTLDQDIANAKNVKTKNMTELLTYLDDYDVLFFATSAQISSEWIPKILKINPKKLIIDLSGAFRLSVDETKEYYQLDIQKEFLSQKNYGLIPFNKTSNLISNPGCYVTATLMALIPLLKENLIDPTSIVIDAKSGTSGAGRSPKDSTCFTEIAQDMHPYKITIHQHEPEIIRYLKYFSQIQDIDLIFNTTLIPTPRGILSAIYARTNIDITHKSISFAYEKHYQNYPLVDFFPLENDDLGFSYKTSLKRVLHTARTQISYTVKNNKLYLFSFIDNLQKGAASQAIENFNQYYEYPIDMGLGVRYEYRAN